VAGEVGAAFGALVDDERVVVPWSYRQSETVSRDQTAGRPPGVIQPSAATAPDASDFHVVGGLAALAIGQAMTVTVDPTVPDPQSRRPA
jgi:hypothetical protein